MGMEDTPRADDIDEDLNTDDDQVHTHREDDSQTNVMPNGTPLLVVLHVDEEQNARLLEEECANEIQLIHHVMIAFLLLPG